MIITSFNRCCWYGKYRFKLLMSLNLNDNSYFGEYLTGLFEGHGHIWIPKKITKKRNNPRFCITFHAKDLKLAEFIKLKIGFGFIRNKVRENAIVYTVSNVEGLLIILQFLNNKMRTPKIIQMNNLITWLNINKNYNLKQQYVCTTDFKLSAWLSGFTEADGCFYIRLSSLKNKSRIAFRFSIDQRLVDPVSNKSYEFIMLKISELFQSKLRIFQNKLNKKYLRLDVSNKSSLNLVFDYFDKFPLYGIKSLNYISWKDAFLIYHDKNNSYDFKIEKIKNIKLSMNNLRNDFFLKHFLV